MKKLIVVLLLAFAVSFAFAQITDKPSEMFPQISMVDPIPHFNGDGQPEVITLYAMQNANHYLDAYKALVVYHNQTMTEAVTLSTVNKQLNVDLAKKNDEIFWASIKWGIIGAGLGALIIAASK
jgi:hypothetical protein